MFARCLLATLLATGTCLAAAPELPATPAAIDELLLVRRFRVEVPFQVPFDVTRPPQTEGALLVLRADPALTYPRQVAEPVLYAGDRMAHRANRAWPSGVVVAFVAGPLDLEGLALWFGTPQLPEQVRAKDIARERRLADGAGIGRRPPDEVARAVAAGGDVVTAHDLFALAPLFEDLERRFAGGAGAVP